MELLRDIHLSQAKQAIILGVVGIARTLGIEVLAEGVESEKELAVLRAAGISLFQGYYFAKPALMTLPPVAGLDDSSPLKVGT
jgi:EAL domain-containing protein (putative c-di-GMP-specific phosphodiesterase class I)